MANLLNNFFGSKSSSSLTATPSADPDFADFTEAAEPIPSPSPFTAVPGGATLGDSVPAPTGRPYTKWYRLDERYTWGDFKIEGVILVLASLLLIAHLLGARANRARARKWMKAHAPALKSEFASVGFDSMSTMDTNPEDTNGLMREKSLFEYASYATGRQNVAFIDVNLRLVKRFNPIMNFVETGLGFFMDTFQVPQDTVEAILYPFDGKESKTVPGLPGAGEVRNDLKSTFDGFVWAVVNKDKMQSLREGRYDVSITFTKDSSKLPSWVTVMSESAEITDLLLTKELVQAVEKAGDLFEYLIITDQPMDKPKTIAETNPRKSIFLRYRMPSSNDYDDLLPLFRYFLRIPDILVKSAHFRPEVLRKVRSIREETIAQIKKTEEKEKEEERAQERDKSKKAKRDEVLSGMDAKAQKKYLEKEREKEMRKQQKKTTVRG